MNVRIVVACLLAFFVTRTSVKADHPLDLVPDKVLGALVFPNLDSFKANGDKFMAGLDVGGWSVSRMMSFAGAELKVSAAAADGKPMGVFWFDQRLVKNNPNNSAELLAAVIPISDVERLAKNLETDVAKLKTGETLRRDGNLGFENRFYRLVGEHLWISSHEELFEHLGGKEKITKFIPQSRLDFLKDSHAIAIFSSQSADDQAKLFQDQAEQWLKENTDADDEEKQAVRELFELVSKVTHLSISMRVDEGLEFDTDVYFKPEHEQAVRKLMERVNSDGKPSSLAGLPNGHVLFSHASRATGRGSLPALSLLGRELNWHWGPSLRTFDKQGFLSQSQQLDFIGIFGEVWHQLDGYRVAFYRNVDETEHGLASLVAILDTKDPQAFMRDMRQLAGFLDGTGLTPQGDDKPDAAGEAVIKQLIADLGDRDFRKRQSATTRLILIGEPASRLIAEAKSSMTREVARRAEMIEAKIAEALKEKRDVAIQPSLISKAKPEFIFFPDRETREGQSVHWVEIKTQANAELRDKLRTLFGPKWQQIRMVPLKDQVVVSIGSDNRLLDETLANLATAKPGLADDTGNAVFKRSLHEKRGAEFHMSPSRFLNMQAGNKPTDPKPDEKSFEQVSFGVTLQPQYLNIEWRIPLGEMRAVRKHLLF